jgi:hypothetical protein
MFLVNKSNLNIMSAPTMNTYPSKTLFPVHRLKFFSALLLGASLALGLSGCATTATVNRSNIGVWAPGELRTENPNEKLPVIDPNFYKSVYTKLGESWGLAINSQEYNKRVVLLVLALGTSGVNGLVENQKFDSQVMLGIDQALDRLMVVMNAPPQSWLGGINYKKIDIAWDDFVDHVTNLKGFDNNCWVSSQKVKKISARFLVAIVKRMETKKIEDYEGASYAYNVIYDNGASHGVRYVRGFAYPGERSLEGCNRSKYFAVMNAFIDFAGQQKSFEFGSKEELDRNSSNASPSYSPSQDAGYQFFKQVQQSGRDAQWKPPIR